MAEQVVTQELSEYGNLTRTADQEEDQQRLPYDVIFEARDKTEIHCHKSVIARQSSMLRLYLANWSRQHPHAVGPARLAMPLPDHDDFTTADFIIIRNFLYTGRCHITSNNIQKILRLADYFQIEFLVEAASKLIVEWMPREQIKDVFELCSVLRKLVTWHVALNFASLLRANALWDLKPAAWRAVLLSSFLAEPEGSVVVAARRYMDRQPADKREAVVKEIVPCLRLGILVNWRSYQWINFMQLRDAQLTYTSQQKTGRNAPQAVSAFQRDHPLESGLQFTPRKQVLHFDPALSPGMRLTDDGGTATATPIQGLAAYAPLFLDPESVSPALLAPVANWPFGRGRAADPSERSPMAFPMQPRIARGQSELSPTSFAAVVPGIVIRDEIFVQLKIGVAHMSPSGSADITIWVMKHPNLKDGGGQARLFADPVGGAYVSGCDSDSADTGRVGKVVPMAYRPRTEVGVAKVPVLRDYTYVEGIQQGDTITVCVQLQTMTRVPNAFGRGIMGFQESTRISFVKKGGHP